MLRNKLDRAAFHPRRLEPNLSIIVIECFLLKVKRDLINFKSKYVDIKIVMPNLN